MTLYLDSRVITREEASEAVAFAESATATLAMVGLTERGPIATPTLCTSFDEFKRVYGGYTTTSKTTVASAQAFFAEGGQFLWFSRTAHWLDVNDVDRGTTMETAEGTLTTLATLLTAASITGTRVGTYSIPDGTTLKLFVDGSVSTTDILFEESTVAVVASTITATVDMDDGNPATIEIKINGGATQTVTMADSGGGANCVDLDAVTRQELVDAINEVISGLATVTGTGFTLTGSTKGASGSIQIVSAHTATGLSAATTNGVTNEMLDATAATITEVVAAITAASGIAATNVGGVCKITSDTTGATSSILVDTTDDSIIADVLGLPLTEAVGTDAEAAVDVVTVFAKDPGVYGDDLQVEVMDASDGVETSFNAAVYQDGVLRETRVNCTSDTIATDFEGSDWVVMETILSTRPANGTYALSGGSDGDAVVDNDFIGVASEANGLYAFDETTDINLLVCPARIRPAVQQAMLAWASTRNYEVTVLLDSEAAKNVQQVATYVVANNLKENTNLGGIFWPHVLVTNPDTNQFTGETITVPPSCFEAGRMARTDAEVSGGVYQASAGVINGLLRSASGLEKLPGRTSPESKRAANRAYAVSYRINPLSIHTGRGVTVEDNMTLKSTGDFNLLNQRRGVSYIERTISRGMEDFRFAGNSARTRAAVNRSITKFLNSQLDLDAFSSRVPEEAYAVDTGKNVNTDAVIESGLLRVRIGLSMITPAKFIELIVSKKISG